MPIERNGKHWCDPASETPDEKGLWVCSCGLVWRYSAADSTWSLYEEPVVDPDPVKEEDPAPAPDPDRAEVEPAPIPADPAPAPDTAADSGSDSGGGGAE